MKEELLHHFQKVRQQTEYLCQPLAIEDYVIQSIEDVSPPKWHLAHTSWFFETFILQEHMPQYQTFHPLFHTLFNSYYQRVGNPYPRARRGLLSRPTVEEIYNYRKHIDTHLLSLLEKASEIELLELEPLITLGLHHEQQHQELLLMDIKHNFSIIPSFPQYQTRKVLENSKNKAIEQVRPRFIEVAGGMVEIGHAGSEFCFDNELPRHQQYLLPYSIATQLVTSGEYLRFIEDGGYQEPRWWLSDGWDCLLKNDWRAPLYWHNFDNEWRIFTLNGLIQLNPAEPVSHLSYYEADAYARWAGARLPSELEWEHFVNSQTLTAGNDNFMETGLFHPQAADSHSAKPQQFFGELWEWTASSYSPYPQYEPLKGALGEYNGKFMANQMVLRGGCCVTPKSHIRASYRNFFQPDKRWQFSGIRLATYS